MVIIHLEVGEASWLRLRQRKKRDWLRLSPAVPKIQWDSDPHRSAAIKLWETCTLFLIFEM